MSLDVKKLIERTEALLEDDQIGFAASLSRLIQNIEIDGQVYELRVYLEPERIILDAPSVDPKLN